MIPQAEINKEEFENVDLSYKEIEKSVKWYDHILLNKPLKLALVFLIIAVLAPLLLYQFLYFSGVDIFTSDGFSLGSCLVPRDSRFPCGYGNITADECHPQCCYDFSNDMCFHRYPSRFSFVMDRVWAENITLKPRVATVPYKFQNSVTNLRVSIDEVSSTHLSITYYESTNESLEGNRIEDKDYSYQIDSPELNIIVNSNRGHNLFDTMRGPLVASKNIWEIAFTLTNETMYGFGEIPIKTDTVKMLYNHKGGFNSIPLIFAKANGSFHGLLIDIPEPTEVVFMSNNGIVVRSINNFGLKFHIFTGPKPVDIMSDVMNLIKFENNLEYWMLGTHICSEIPTTTSEISTFIEQSNREDIPYDSHCVTPITFNNECENSQVAILNDGATLYRNTGKKIVPHISPYIFYEENELDDTLEGNEIVTRENTQCYRDFSNYREHILKNPETMDKYKGLINNNDVIYPNFENVSEEFMNELWVYTEDFDGIVLENTWPLDESEKFVNETHYYLPYFSENFEEVSKLTLKWNITDNEGDKHLYKHNEYGNHFADAIQTIKPVPTWSSSHWMSSKTYVNRQNVKTSWSSFNKEIVEAALGGISGQWLWSSPICGDTENFNNETNASLCVKWYMAATYLPMIRIHSKEIARDPLGFPAFERNLMITALRNRMALAPYFYTTLQRGPLLRTMFFQYPEIEELHDLTNQFCVGDDLMIVPNLQPFQSMVHFMVPAGTWYEFWGGLKLHSDRLETVTMMTTESDFLVLMRAGAIVVLQADVRLSAVATRTNSNLTLKIGLNCNINETTANNNITGVNDTTSTNETDCFASGNLHLDKNRTVHFEADNDKLTITADGDYSQFCVNNDWATRINGIDIYGLDEASNNFDNHKTLVVNIDLCSLQDDGEIAVDLTGG